MQPEVLPGERYEAFLRGGAAVSFGDRLAEIRTVAAQAATLQVVEPTLRRLDLILRYSLNLHVVDALMLAGSVSWGRFHAVRERPDRPSDIDLFAVVPHYGELNGLHITVIDPLFLPDEARSLMAFVDRCLAVERADMLVLHGCTRDGIEASLTVSDASGFLRVMDDGQDTVTAWRPRGVGLPTITALGFDGVRHTRPVIEDTRGPGCFVTMPVFGDLGTYRTPSCFQQLFLPALETIGPCAEYVATKLCQLGRDTATRASASALGRLQWHFRRSRMPQWVIAQADAWMRDGRRPLA
jgi:hypothetical protein